MKTVSITLTVMLIFPLMKFLALATQFYIGYPSFKNFGVSLQEITKWEMPYIILCAVCFIFFAFSVFLTAKGKYITNAVFSGLILMIYVINLLFFGFYWMGGRS
jgi:hypothetical protein